MPGISAQSSPYPWPWHGSFDPAGAALLIVRDGQRAMPGATRLATLQGLAKAASCAGILVGDLPSVEIDWQAGVPFDFVVPRPHNGGFSGTDLDAVLRSRRITDLIFAGYPFEVGADTTMRQANDLGYECLAVPDVCTGLAEDTLAGAISSIQMSGGIFGAVASLRDVVHLFERVTGAQQTKESIR